MEYVQCRYMVHWSKMHCRQGEATRRKWFKVVKFNIYYFHTFKNVHECWRGNVSKSIDCCSTAMVSWDLSRLRTSHAIMLCGKELVINACMRMEIHLLCICSRGDEPICYRGPLCQLLLSKRAAQFLVILWNLLKTNTIVHQQKQTTNESNNCWSRLNA